MKLLVGSYNENVYEIEIKNNRFTKSTLRNKDKKPSFLLDFDDLSYIYQQEDVGFVKIGEQRLNVKDSSCHISFDKKNKNIYVSHYQSGKLTVIKKETNWKINEVISFTNKSHVHYAEYIPTIDLIGVVDLGDNKFHLFNSIDNNLNIKASYSFDKNYGPRHFAFHHQKPIVYLVTEHIPAIFVFEYRENEIILLEKHLLSKGAGSAIRINSNSTMLVAAVRVDNMLFNFNIKENGLLKFVQKIHTHGDHPRDFNISPNNNYLVVANMHSHNLTLFEIFNNKLYLLEKDYYLDSGASVIFKND